MGEWLTTAMSTRQNEFFQYEKGLIDEEVWTASLGVIKTIMSIDFCRFWWESWDKNVLSPRFVTIVDEIVKSSFDWKFSEHFELLKNKSRGNVDA
jgi:hypothetical protein